MWQIMLKWYVCLKSWRCTAQSLRFSQSLIQFLWNFSQFGHWKELLSLESMPHLVDGLPMAELIFFISLISLIVVKNYLCRVLLSFYSILPSLSLPLAIHLVLLQSLPVKQVEVLSYYTYLREGHRVVSSPTYPYNMLVLKHQQTFHLTELFAVFSKS